MRVIYNPLGLNQELADYKVNTFVFDVSKTFGNICEELWKASVGMETQVIFSEGEKSVDLHKSGTIVFNPFSIESNERKLLTQLYKEMTTVVYDNHMDKKIVLQQQMIEYMEEIIQDMPYPIQYSLEIDDTALFKMLQVQFDEYDGSIVERISNYIKLAHKIGKIQVFIFVGLKNYITEEEFFLLYDTIKYENVYFINIDRKIDYSLERENICILDKDLCIIEGN